MCLPPLTRRKPHIRRQDDDICQRVLCRHLDAARRLLPVDHDQ